MHVTLSAVSGLSVKDFASKAKKAGAEVQIDDGVAFAFFKAFKVKGQELKPYVSYDGNHFMIDAEDRNTEPVFGDYTMFSTVRAAITQAKKYGPSFKIVADFIATL